MVMTCEECGTRLWKAGETAPAGIYMRADDSLMRTIAFERAGPLPASLDGHVALYRSAQSGCLCHQDACPYIVGAGTWQMAAGKQRSAGNLPGSIASAEESLSR